MEVMIPSQPVDFNFDSACTTPYISAPSSPQRFGNFFYSAPTSPTRISAFYGGEATSSAVPFNWEEKPGIPKSNEALTDQSCTKEENDDDFAFDFSGQLEKPSLSAADELFDGGKIKPLKPPPRFQYDSSKTTGDYSPRSPRSPKQVIKEAFSPRNRNRDFDPFAAALEQSRKGNLQEPTRNQRGRERTCSNSGSNSRHKSTRSLSPLRVSDLLFDRVNNPENSDSASSANSSSSFIGQWYRKWKLKDLLLFRSASEGRASSKEEFNKYAILRKSNQEDVKNSSFRSTDSVGSSVSCSRRRGSVSAHELHYTANRAVSEEMKKKTYLPYKRGLLGCLGFNQAAHEISRSLVSMTRS